jgi:fatty-acyl-CoA synthase
MCRSSVSRIPSSGRSWPLGCRCKPGVTLTEGAVKEHCRGRLAHYKVPRYVVFVDEFPMTVTGKVQKFRMREATMLQLGLKDGPPSA